MAKRILHAVTNVSHYDDPSHPTGLWLPELVHAWEVFEGHVSSKPLSARRGSGPARGS